ncbi:MAG: hypothetical protein GY898_16455 [Proteobacteria bacterium]|nr:hypothetical protein [Pseudomonadota bacterium]
MQVEPEQEEQNDGLAAVQAVARALTEFPEFNGFWRDGAFVPGAGIHVGFAISLRGGGLLAPALRDADQRSLDELMDDLRSLVHRTRTGGLTGSELTDPTVTVTSLGERGADEVFGVIQPPQVAILGFGTPVERAVVCDGFVQARRGRSRRTAPRRRGGSRRLRRRSLRRWRTARRRTPRSRRRRCRVPRRSRRRSRCRGRRTPRPRWGRRRRPRRCSRRLGP